MGRPQSGFDEHNPNLNVIVLVIIYYSLAVQAELMVLLTMPVCVNIEVIKS